MIFNPRGTGALPYWDRDTRLIVVSIPATSMANFCTEQAVSEVDITQRFRFQNGALTRNLQQLMACFEDLKGGTEKLRYLSRFF